MHRFSIPRSGFTPYRLEGLRDYIKNMKIKQELTPMFGGLVSAACPDWLTRCRAGKPVRSGNEAHPATLRFLCFFQKKIAGVQQMKTLVDRVKIGLAIVGLTVLTGCIGVEDGGGYSGGEVGWWGGGGGYDRGHDVQTYSARGATSRGVAYGGGGGQAKGGGGEQAKGGGEQAKGEDKH
jgi:hypothetical protein